MDNLPEYRQNELASESGRNTNIKTKSKFAFHSISINSYTVAVNRAQIYNRTYLIYIQTSISLEFCVLKQSQHVISTIKHMYYINLAFEWVWVCVRLCMNIDG